MQPRRSARLSEQLRFAEEVRLRDAVHAANDLEELKNHLESMPLDIYLLIRDFVFVLPKEQRLQKEAVRGSHCVRGNGSEQVVFIDGRYIPPKYLQLNRATRRVNAKRYYAKTIFVAVSARYALKFLWSIGYEHSSMMRHRIEIAERGDVTVGSCIARRGDKDVYTWQDIVRRSHHVDKVQDKQVVFW